MRKREARRLCEFLFGRNYISHNFYKFVVERFEIKFSQNTRHYYIKTYYIGCAVFRRHRCCFKLCKIIYQLFQSSVTHFQKQDVVMAPERNKDLLSEIKGRLADGFVIQGCRNYGTISKLTPVKKNKDLLNFVEDGIGEYFPQLMDNVKKNYVHSSRITDNELVSPAFCKLASRPVRKLNRQVCKDMIALNVAKRVMDGQYKKKLVTFSARDMSSCELSDSSASGIIPVRPVQGVATLCAGKKKDMRSAAIAVNIYDRISGKKPGSIPVKVFLKSEVLKVGKPIRGILNESLANYLILKIADPDAELDIRSGNSIGMGSKANGYIQIFFRWYLCWYKETGGKWSAFLDFMAEQGAHESDKVGWEASTNITDGLPWLVDRLNSVKCDQVGDKYLYVRAISDYINPFIYLDRCGFYAPWRVPSGTYYTSKGNTHRHQSMNRWMCSFIKRHGYRIGSSGCGCFVCAEVSGVGLKVSPLLVKLRELAFLLGDDFIAISMGGEADALFDRVLDFVFGTETKTEKKNWFKEPHCEFLRRSFIREGERVHVFRQSERVLAKLYHGEFMCDPSQALAAMVSLKFEVGYNRGMQRLLGELMEILRETADNAAYTKNLDKYCRRNPAIADIPFWTKIMFEDIVNVQGEYVNQLLSMIKAVNH